MSTWAPGFGGVLSCPKNTPEIARIGGGRDCLSQSSHTALFDVSIMPGQKTAAA